MFTEEQRNDIKHLSPDPSPWPLETTLLDAPSLATALAASGIPTRANYVEVAHAMQHGRPTHSASSTDDFTHVLHDMCLLLVLLQHMTAERLALHAYVMYTIGAYHQDDEQRELIVAYNIAHGAKIA